MCFSSYVKQLGVKLLHVYASKQKDLSGVSSKDRFFFGFALPISANMYTFY